MYDAPRERKPGVFRRLVRRLFGSLPPPSPPPLDPPDEEYALIRVNPRRPLGSGSVALELPVEPRDVDARGRRYL
jgi:hypothetical protein